MTDKNGTTMFTPVRVTRTTAETEFEATLEPRLEVMEPLPIPNRLLSHFLDHFAQASAVNVRLAGADWPGSWRFDHVLCEDLGQLVGRGVAEIHDRRAARDGVPGARRHLRARSRRVGRPRAVARGAGRRICRR